MHSEEPYLHAIAAFRPFVTPNKLRAWIRAAGTPRVAWEMDDAALRRLAWTDEQRARLKTHREQWNVERRFAELTTSDITFLTDDAPAFPPLLREIYDPPLALYVRGHGDLSGPTVAVVGSRKATPYGKTATNILVRPLASRGVTIVSGLAYGIDAEAHRAALAVQGRTVAVLGSGVDDAALYPRAHRALAADIIQQGGAVVSEYPPGTTPEGYFFPQRNRLISGLAHVTVIVEADESSGALITAKSALEQNREVFAVPGPITSPLSQGTNALLREGAAPARSAEDLFEELARAELLPAESPAATTSLPHAEPDAEMTMVLTMLSATPRGVDEIIELSTLPPNVVAAVLTTLELDGRVRDVGGKQYVRV